MEKPETVRTNLDEIIADAKARSAKTGLTFMGVPVVMHDCHDCGAKPGEPHGGCCDVEVCSVCGGQRLCCNCPGHDEYFARWTGFWPGMLECIALGIDLNTFAAGGFDLIFHVKP